MSNDEISQADLEDSLTVEVDMKSYKFFDYDGLKQEVIDWFRDTIGPECVKYADYKKALKEGERTYMLEYIGTTGLNCCYITFTKKSDIVLFKMAWAGDRGQRDDV